jgi:hypothetical protein
MKKLALFSLFGLLALGGCARHYVVTLNNGGQIGATGKPRREGPVYVFKDATGMERRIAAGSVSEIAPASMSGGSGTSDKFKFAPSK